ncbi:Minor histocompatibility antigen H13 [Fasciolopsis buskii]|uniref:Minor histocompatibility antigen H13 n=1 Tax=Fasciolopsis buskii TaxID=27845 RepID=A0A8E0RKQ6_9TREM|nr:Minor histocompatibility antigen H13 [Fasciolopsis buski]
MDPVTAVHNVTKITTTTFEATPASLLLSSVVLFLLALGPIFFGSFRSKEAQDKEDMEVVTSRSAAMFPIIASGALLSIYIVFKFLPTYYINLLVNFYFSLLGTGAMVKLFSTLFRVLVPKSVTNNLYKIEFTKSIKAKTEDNAFGWKVVDDSSVECETRDFPGIIFAVAIGIWYFATRHWIANNCVAYSLAVLAIEYIKLNKFINGCLLLGGLFFYDIFWVFGTPVMVTVAKSLDAPIKMSFPRDFLVHGFFGKEFAILGLGDIVVPGIFIAMLLRFDISLKRKDSTLYFLTGFVAYVIGLLTTFIVMHAFKAAQVSRSLSSNHPVHKLKIYYDLFCNYE